jgi:hypothetical protein
MLIYIKYYYKRHDVIAGRQSNSGGIKGQQSYFPSDLQ